MKYQLFNFLLSFLFILCTIPQAFTYTEEPIIIREMKYEVQQNSGFSIDVQVIINEKSRLQDLYITPAKGKTYSLSPFLYSVALAVARITQKSVTYQVYTGQVLIDINGEAVARITQKSVTYQVYTGQVLIDINGEFWAISAEMCREVFELGTVEEQNKTLQKKLIRLR